MLLSRATAHVKAPLDDGEAKEKGDTECEESREDRLTLIVWIL